MQLKEWKTSYAEYADTTQLSERDRSLLTAAEEALGKSYAPYSRFRVAAAVHLENGQVISGANQENAAYPMCLCAERVALATAQSSFPGTKVKAMAITVSHDADTGEPATPCGACRQVIVEQEERQGAPISILLKGQNGKIWKFGRGRDLLPFPFTGKFL